MDKIKELREAAMRLQTEARSKLEEAQRLATEGKADEADAAEAEADRLMAERDKKVDQADRLQRLEDGQRSLDAAAEARDRQQRESQRPGAAAAEHAPQTPSVTDEYREAFRELLLAGGNVSDLSSEHREALRGGAVAGEARQQLTTSGAAGGYTVPETLASTINIAMAANGPMMDGTLVTLMRTGGGAPIVMPTIDDTDQEAAAHAEGDEPADDNSGDVTIGKSELGAYSYITPWIKWAMELSQDSSYSWEDLLGRLIGERLGRLGNRLLTVGTGAGQPLGFVTSAPVGHEAAAASITFDNVMDLEHSVDPAYRMGDRVAFQMHDNSRKALRKVKNAEGNFVWSDGDVIRGIPPSLLGYPVRYNQAMAEIGAGAKTIAFGNFSEFYARQVGNPIIGVAREKFFPNLGIAGVMRLDGAVGQAKAIKVLQHAAA